MSAVTEFVAAGAACLDQTDPGWWAAGSERAVDLDWLDLSEGNRCVLGQRCPPEARIGHPWYSTGYQLFAAQLAGADPADVEAVDTWASARGFIVRDWKSADDESAATTAEYDALTAEWKRVITGRRTAS